MAMKVHKINRNKRKHKTKGKLAAHANTHTHTYNFIHFYVSGNKNAHPLIDWSCLVNLSHASQKNIECGAASISIFTRLMCLTISIRVRINTTHAVVACRLNEYVQNGYIVGIVSGFDRHALDWDTCVKEGRNRARLRNYWLKLFTVYGFRTTIISIILVRVYCVVNL